MSIFTDINGNMVFAGGYLADDDAFSNSFYADPFSSYTSYIADQTFSGTNGTVTTVNWNGSTLTAPTYGPDANGTFQPAINAAAAVNGGANQRVCVLAGQIWAYASPNQAHVIPNLTGTTPTSRFVIQGDPASTEVTMPKIDGLGQEGYGITIGGGNTGPLGPAYGWSASNPNVTIRKLHITNFSGTVDGSEAATAIHLSNDNYDGLVIEFCKLHRFRQIIGPGGGGPVYCSTIKDTATFEVRYNKMFDDLDNRALGTGYFSGNTLTITALLPFGAFTGTLVSGSNVISNVTTNTNMRTGQLITDANGALPANSTITAIGSGTGTITVSNSATATVSTAENFNYYGAFAVGQDVSVAVSGAVDNTIITALGTGTGFLGTYTVNNAQNTASTTIIGAIDDGRPFAAVETYGGVFNIHHNEIWAINTAFAGKVLTPATPNGSIHHNLIHDAIAMIEFEPGGEWTGINGISVYNNLFYWTHYNDTIFGTPNNASVYSDSGSNGNTTYPTGFWFYNNTLDPSIGGQNGLAPVTLENVWCKDVKFYNNVILSSTPISTNGDNSAGYLSLCDNNVFFNPSTFYVNLYGTGQAAIGGLSAWQQAHTNYPTLTGLLANPDTNSVDIATLASPWNTIADNFPNYTTYDYTIASGSPLSTVGTGGSTPGYNSKDCGPGW